MGDNKPQSMTEYARNGLMIRAKDVGHESYIENCASDKQAESGKRCNQARWGEEKAGNGLISQRTLTAHLDSKGKEQACERHNYRQHKESN
jgi:hypothetical protein